MEIAGREGNPLSLELSSSWTPSTPAAIATHTALQTPQELSTAQRAGSDMMTFKSPSQPQTLSDLSWASNCHTSVTRTATMVQCNTPYVLGKVTPHIREGRWTSASTSPAAPVSTAWELQMLKSQFELPSPAFFVLNFPVFLLILKWLSSFPYGIHPLSVGMHSHWKKAWPQLPQEAAPLQAP